KLEGFKVLGKIERVKREDSKTEEKQTEKVVDVTPAGNPKVSELEIIRARAGKLQGLKAVQEIILPNDKTNLHSPDGKRSRKRIGTDNVDLSIKYNKGEVITSTIKQIIAPSQVITELPDGFVGRLSILDISWCFPAGEDELKKYRVGDSIKCTVLEINIPNQQVILSKKHLSKPITETVAWERIERGDEFYADVIETFNNTTLVKTKDNFYGVINNHLLQDTSGRIRVKVNSKLDFSELFSFVPASLDVENIDSEEVIDPGINFIEDELLSFYNFKNSILGVYATDDQLSIIKKGFEQDDRIFSKEFKTNQTLYVKFDLGSASYETTLKQNAIPYFLNDTVVSSENENKLLELLSNQHHYWFKINARDNNQKIDFSLYNEEVNIFGDITISKDKKEIKFIIKNFTFGHSQFTSSEAKKRNAKYGSFLFSNKLKIISPYGTSPFDSSQQLFLDYALLKTQCFETVNQLKTEAGEILRQEGRTLSIIDKFLEYQISLIDKEKENAVFVDKYDRVPAINQGVAITIPRNIGDSLETDEETVVNIRLKEDEKLIKISDGVLSYFNDQYTITFNKPIKLELLDKGFYIDKRISKKQFQIQRGIIQDFLDKKIKIDHIEALLVKPDRVKTPILKPIQFKNEDLSRTEKEDSTNNQVKAVKKAVGNQNIFLIQGPPGTGKTTVIAEIIQQLVEKGEKIIVSGQNHVAVDNVLEKLSQFHHLNLLRVGNPDRIDKQLLKYCIDNLVEDYKVDFKSFISNQLLIAEEYLKNRNFGFQKDILNKSLNQFINLLIVEYGVLKDVYKQRHFILLDGLSELSETEIKKTIELLKKWIDESNNEYEILLKPLIYNSIDVVFATCIGIKSDDIFKDKNFKFDTVIIDEAGKANIAESLVAIELGQKVILVGDQKQLPPYMDSSLIDKADKSSFPNTVYGADFLEEEILHALKSSFFEFIVNRINAEQFPKDNMEMLNYQHRMHPNIGEFVSKSFYDGMVKMGSRTHLNRIEMPSPFNKEVVFFDTSNSKSPFEQNDGFSAKNNTEAVTISEIILPKIFESEVNPTNIAIIAPYKSQVANIKNYINKSESCKFKNIDVSTLDSFQGKEYDIIIFSFTRSSDHNNAPIENGKRKYAKVGFLDDARRLNVAFSRAKKKLVLIGNSKTLTDSRSHFDKVFNYTELFRTLVRLSNKEEIGNFINVADLYDFKSPFDLFIEKFKQGDNTVGRFKAVGRNLNGIFGLFVTVDGVDCLIPYSMIPKQIRENINSLALFAEMDVSIYLIDIENKRVTLKFNEKNKNITGENNERWTATVNKYKKGDFVNGTIEREVNFGYFIKIDTGLEGLLHKNDIINGKVPKLNETLEVKIIKVDFEKRQIAFSY
ncbi:MAG: S1 RNA-binding domain-containing protein, partial [Cytophagales bacterium]|nr:S1 RNA-binding domain-containing protein [Cytophagales bacterium]